MGGSRLARPDVALPAADAADKVEQPLDELCAAIERAAERYRSDLEALDDRPVILPGARWPRPSASPAVRAHVSTGMPDPPFSAKAVVIAPTRPRPRSVPRWIWLGAVAMLSLLTLLMIADRRPPAALATAPIAAQAASPAPTSPAFATVALPLLLPPAATATQDVAPTATPMPMVVVPTTAPVIIPTTVSPVVPTPIPTPAPTATPQSTATMPSSPTAPPPTATLPPPTTLASQVAASEAALQTGSFEITIDYGQGNHSTVAVHFDLGGAGRERGLVLASTSTGHIGEQRLELLAIGDRIWQRQPGRGWEPGVSQDGVWEQFQAYLPQLSNATDVTVARAGEMLILRWADRSRGADLELHIAASDGRLFRLQERSPATGVVMMVTYTGWNTPVAIAPPDR